LSLIGNYAAFPLGDFSTVYQLQDQLSRTMGRHTLKFGVEFRWLKLNGPLDFGVNGLYEFEDLTAFGLPALSNNPALEFFPLSLNPIPDDNGNVGGVLSIAVETTERMIEDRRRHLLRDLAARTAGTRNQEEVWLVSTETFGENCVSLPFAFLYKYRPSDDQAHLAGASVGTAEALRPPVIDCHSENLWRLDPAPTRDGVVIELGDRASGVPVPNWPGHPKEANVVPIRLGEHGETLGFLVAGIHPGRRLTI
jgi:hypothetical protein